MERKNGKRVVFFLFRGRFKYEIGEETEQIGSKVGEEAKEELLESRK